MPSMNFPKENSQCEAERARSQKGGVLRECYRSPPEGDPLWTGDGWVASWKRWDVKGRAGPLRGAAERYISPEGQATWGESLPSL